MFPGENLLAENAFLAIFFLMIVFIFRSYM